MEQPLVINIVTGNPGKRIEFAKVFQRSGLNAEFRNIKMDLQEVQEETSVKVSEHKMREFLGRHPVNESEMYVIEDTSLRIVSPEFQGLCIPGPFIKFWGKDDNFDALLAAFPGKRAVAEAVITVHHNGITKQFVGALNGRIVSGKDNDMPRGDNGFGWDRQFVVDGYDKTLSELTRDEKNEISHRRKAIDKMVEYVKTL